MEKRILLHHSVVPSRDVWNLAVSSVGLLRASDAVVTGAHKTGVTATATAAAIMAQKSTEKRDTIMKFH